MTVSSKDIHDATGFKYIWITKHFGYLALETYKHIGHATYNIYNVSDILSYINTYNTACKNPAQVEKSFQMMNKLKEVLNDTTLSRP